MNPNDAKSIKSINFLMKMVLFGPAVALKFTTMNSFPPLF